MYATFRALSVVIFAVMVALYLRHPSASIFHPASFYLMFHGLVFVVRPIFAWYYGYDRLYHAIGFWPTQWEKTQVLICTNLGLVVFMAVIMLATREPMKFNQDEFDLQQRELLLRRFWLVAIPLGLFAAYSIVWFWDFKQSGELLTILDRASGSRALDGVDGYFLSAGAMLAPIVAIFAYLGRFKLWSLLPFIGFAVLKLGTGGRGNAVAAAVMIALLYMFDRRKKWPSHWWSSPRCWLCRCSIPSAPTAGPESARPSASRPRTKTSNATR